MFLFEPLWFWPAAVVLVCRHWPLCVAHSVTSIQKNTAGLTRGEDVDRRGHPRCDAILRRIEMMPFLILARAAIIGWTRLAVFPLEITFDAVEGELKRQGVEL
jgi:hypothetical protein